MACKSFSRTGVCIFVVLFSRTRALYQVTELIFTEANYLTQTGFFRVAGSEFRPASIVIVCGRLPVTHTHSIEMAVERRCRGTIPSSHTYRVVTAPERMWKARDIWKCRYAVFQGLAISQRDNGIAQQAHTLSCGCNLED